MRISYNARKCNIWDSTKEYTEKKLAKLDRFFSGDCEVHVVYTLESEGACKVELTADYDGLIFRAQSCTPDFKISVDEAVDTLIRKIRKHKTKLEKRLRIDEISFEGFGDYDAGEEDRQEIKRTKTVALSPMDEDEAVLQMNMLGHDFFLYRDVSTGAVKLIYRRKDGDYGLIVTE